MSRFYVTAIERLGAPDPLWPTVYGPALGADPVAANGLATLDLTPFLTPLGDFNQQMERDLTGGSFSSIKLDLVDGDGSLSDTLGPFSATMAAPSRYFGPWIQVIERWGSGEDEQEALRFLGYLDETSIQWDEDGAKTQATAIHASQLLRERLITDYPELLRPWPSVPTNASQEFLQVTADAALPPGVGFVPRPDAAAIEAAQWAAGKLTWVARVQKVYRQRAIEHVDADPTISWTTTTYPVPAAPASSVIIGGQAFAVDHMEWDGSIESNVEIGDPAGAFSRTTYRPVRIVLQGMPDLTGLLHLGDTVTWGIPESQRTHYLLQGGAITEPPSGSDGPKFVDLNTVEQLAVGDVLTLTFVDATSGAPRTVTADLPRIIDLDGETGKAHLAEALSQGYAHVSKVRRNGQDPVHIDGLAYARALIAPFTLDTAEFAPAPTDVPVLVWQPYDVAAPALYGVHNLQAVNQTGGLILARRGADNSLGGYPTAGIWAGSWGGTWAWLGQPSPEATHEIYGDVLQWPGGVNPYAPPVIYIEGDLSGGAATPPNGWRSAWRTWHDLEHVTQDPQSTWTGSAVAWEPATASGDIPAKLIAYAASTATPGRYTRTNGGTWGFSAHTGNATLATPVAPTITGSLPAGGWLALGMGILADGDEREALLGLVATGASLPFTEVKAVLLSQAAGGDLTLEQTESLWATGAIPAGPWALGGGLVVQTWKETIGGIDYPHTVLHKLDGAAVTTAALKTLEVIPQSIQPLLPIGEPGSRRLGGWYALALETFADDNFAPARRLRFLHLDADLQLVNGELEADPSTPTNPETDFSRGDLVASLVPDGAIIAKMVRTSNLEDRMSGLAGGRIFTVASELPTTIERLKLGATVPSGGTLSVAHSGDGMSAADFLTKFAAAQLASAVPLADGNMALVSRSAGTLRLRAIGAQQVSVQASERGKHTKTQAWQGYIRKARVQYQDVLTGDGAAVEVTGDFDGGRILEMDFSDLVAGPTMAVAVGRAAIFWLGRPAPVLGEIWVDRSGGVAGDQAPAWWSDWRVGDRIVLEPFTTPGPMVTWKILKMAPGLESRSVNVELRQQPILITPGV